MLEKAEEQPNITISVLVSIVVILASILLKVLFGGKKPVSVAKLSTFDFRQSHDSVLVTLLVFRLDRT